MGSRRSPGTERREGTEEVVKLVNRLIVLAHEHIDLRHVFVAGGTFPPSVYLGPEPVNKNETLAA